MIGLLFFGALGTGALAKGAVNIVKDDIDLENSRREARKNHSHIVYCSNGKSYFHGTRCFVTEKNGHKIIEDFKTGKVLYDYTQREINHDMKQVKKIFNEARENAVLNNQPFFCFEAPYFYNSGFYSSINYGIYNGIYETKTNKKVKLVKYQERHNDGTKYYYSYEYFVLYLNCYDKYDYKSIDEKCIDMKKITNNEGKCLEKTYNITTIYDYPKINHKSILYYDHRREDYKDCKWNPEDDLKNTK